ncbi:hypothetical protein BH18ACI5_BH18ACI5_29490 [soil metagenome]
MLGSYLAERFGARVFAPLAIVIAVAASAGELSFAGSGADAIFALLLLAQFRSWDDLADRGHDAVAHPDRVVVRAASVAPLVAFSGGLAIVNICLAVLRDGTGIAVAVVTALIGILGIWYSLRRGRTAAGDSLLLSKYPAMVVVIAGSRVLITPLPILASALALYVAVCVYEVWHDPASPLFIGGHR